jgi:hypothetical protein
MGGRITAFVLCFTVLGPTYANSPTKGEPATPIVLARDATENPSGRLHPGNEVYHSMEDRTLLLSEGFEAWLPSGWDTLVTDTSNSSGWYPSTWHQSDVIYFGGEWSASVWWSYEPQSEWLITPGIHLTGSPVDGYTLQFWSYGYEGSTHGDHYEVLISTDGGSTWTDPLLDLSGLDGGWNEWYCPYTLDLDEFGGQTVRIAFRARGEDGLWYAWAVDDVRVMAQGIPPDYALVHEFDFNEDDGGFVHLNPHSDPDACCLGTDDWEWGTPVYEEGPEVGMLTCEDVPLTQCWGTDLDGPYACWKSSGRLVSPCMFLPEEIGIESCEMLLLEICHYYDVEEGFDGGNVVVFSGCDESYDAEPDALLAPIGGKLYDAVASPGCFFYTCLVDNEAAFTGYTMEWMQSYFDLSAYRSSDVRIGFDFGSDPCSAGPGWYVKWLRVWCISEPTGAREDSGRGTRAFGLTAPTPSVITSGSEILFTLEEAGFVTLEVIDPAGRTVRELVRGPMSAGDHRLRFDGRDGGGTSLPAGIYFLHLRSGTNEAIRKVALMN